MYTYPRPQNLAYPDRVLSNEGPLSRSDPKVGQSESWLDRGAPERLTAWWLVERWEALRLALGARGCLAARGGFTTCLKGAGWCPGASHRSIPSRFARDW
jgi:hypothetical protein